jgi:hypothetical protein
MAVVTASQHQANQYRGAGVLVRTSVEAAVTCKNKLEAHLKGDPVKDG